jgi:cytochrome c oxidase subunit 2
MLNAIQSALAPAGIQAARIETLWWLMFSVTGAVTILVYAVLGVALWRGSRRESQTTRDDRRLLRRIGLATAASLVILFGLLLATVVASRAIASQRDDTALVVVVTAYQWWWDVEYQHPEPEQRVRTANELHLPVGRTTAIKLFGADVIHSFWAPALHGKLDAIPGHESILWLRPDRTGVYRGQCAEYCGLQHAHMAFTIVVEESDAFERWIQGQRVTAAQPATELARRGQQLVQSGTCVMCHQIRGTAAAAQTAPDLTHVATRSTIGAGTLPTTRENLAAWIRNAQSFKPGARMPPMSFSSEDLAAIVAYVEGLR